MSDETTHLLEPPSAANFGIRSSKGGLFSSIPAHLRHSARIILSSLILLNVILFSILGVLPFLVGANCGRLISACLIAYSFGLRHAVDADHIAAIDNVVRRLVGGSEKPSTGILLVGFWFSLGHSTIVFGLVVVVASVNNFINKSDDLDNWKETMSYVGTSFSASILLLVGLANVFIGFKLYNRRSNVDDSSDEEDSDGEHMHLTASGAFFSHTHKHIITIDGDGNIERTRKAGDGGKEIEDEDGLAGFFTRCCPSLLNAIDAPYKMYFIGFLFGLGLDTATEVALLGLTVVQSDSQGEGEGEGGTTWVILLLPLMFTAGMILIDTADGILMLAAYGWASVSR